MPCLAGLVLLSGVCLSVEGQAMSDWGYFCLVVCIIDLDVGEVTDLVTGETHAWTGKTHRSLHQVYR